MTTTAESFCKSAASVSSSLLQHQQVLDEPREEAKRNSSFDSSPAGIDPSSLLPPPPSSASFHGTHAHLRVRPSSRGSLSSRGKFMRTLFPSDDSSSVSSSFNKRKKTSSATAKPPSTPQYISSNSNNNNNNTSRRLVSAEALLSATKPSTARRAPTTTGDVFRGRRLARTLFPPTETAASNKTKLDKIAATAGLGKTTTSTALPPSSSSSSAKKRLSCIAVNSKTTDATKTSISGKNTDCDFQPLKFLETEPSSNFYFSKRISNVIVVLD